MIRDEHGSGSPWDVPWDVPCGSQQSLTEPGEEGQPGRQTGVTAAGNFTPGFGVLSYYERDDHGQLQPKVAPRVSSSCSWRVPDPLGTAAFAL